MIVVIRKGAYLETREASPGARRSPAGRKKASSRACDVKPEMARGVTHAPLNQEGAVNRGGRQSGGGLMRDRPVENDRRILLDVHFYLFIYIFKALSRAWRRWHARLTLIFPVLYDHRFTVAQVFYREHGAKSAWGLQPLWTALALLITYR